MKAPRLRFVVAAVAVVDRGGELPAHSRDFRPKVPREQNYVGDFRGHVVEDRERDWGFDGWVEIDYLVLLQ
jgi:hypothetical protein